MKAHSNSASARTKVLLIGILMDTDKTNVPREKEVLKDKIKVSKKKKKNPRRSPVCRRTSSLGGTELHRKMYFGQDAKCQHSPVLTCGY